MTESRYARIYWTVMDDTKFDGIREDPKLFGSWALCLVVADMAYPQPAFIPPMVPKAALARLTECGLIDRVDSLRFIVHGLAAERERRSASARVGGLASGRSRAVERPSNDRSTKSNLAEQSKAEQSTADAREPDRPDVDAFLAVRFRLPTTAQRDLMDAYVRVFDVTGPQRAADLIYANPADPIGALKADLEAFRRERSDQARSQERTKPIRRKGSGMSGLNQELSRMLGLEYEHQNGDHDGTPADGCRFCKEGAA